MQHNNLLHLQVDPENTALPKKLKSIFPAVDPNSSLNLCTMEDTQHLPHPTPTTREMSKLAEAVAAEDERE
jgi:hypothetical protein